MTRSQTAAPRGTFLSADGTERCRDCHLHECECTCNSEWQRLLFGLIAYANDEGPAPIVRAKADARTEPAPEKGAGNK